MTADRLPAAAPAWSKEPPTVPGAYWMRCDERGTQVVTLYDLRGLAFVEGTHTFFADVVGLYWHNVEWFGPLEVPQ